MGIMVHYIEKTVPAGSFDCSGTRVIDVITSDLANTILFSPGGYGCNCHGHTLNTAFKNPHSLLGDSTGGENDAELDFSTCPVNYTPVNDTTATPASAPRLSINHTITLYMNRLS